MTETDALIGARLGKYRITARLGSGGMGVVYAGEDRRLRRPVAVKVLSRGPAGDGETIRRFLREAQAAARLTHPNVVTVHDVGQTGVTCYIVMELVPGGSAAGRIQERGPMPWRDATRLVADICRGLAAAHAAGLVHRDIKPANVLIADGGAGKLADFGLATARGQDSNVGRVVGTPQFMSPEQCAGERTDERTDLYSLGATYYALLTGRPPFDGDDELKILFAHCSAPIPDPCAVVAELPAGCGAVVQRAMAKSRGDRYASADDLLAALTALLAGEPLPAPSPAPRPPSLPPTRQLCPPRRPRRRLRFLLIPPTVAVLAGAFTWAVSRPPRTAPPPPPERTMRRPEPTAPFGSGISLRPRREPVLWHAGEARAVSLAGGRVASAGADGTVRVRALGGAGEPLVLRCRGGAATVALSPDGSMVAAGGVDRALYLFSLPTGQEMRPIPNLGGQITAVAFSPAGDWLAVATASGLLLFECRPGGRFQPRAQLLSQQYMVSAVVFSGDSRRLAASTLGKAVHVWDLTSLTEYRPPGELPPSLVTVALTPTGDRVVFACRTGYAYIWEPSGNRPPAELARSGAGYRVAAFAPGGGLVLGGAWGAPLEVRDLAAGRTTATPTGFAGSVTAVAFAPDGRLFAAAGTDGAVRLWDVGPASEAR